MKFETKFELGMKPWCITCGADGWEVFQDKEPITEIQITIMEGHFFVEPHWGGIAERKEYKFVPYPTREEAIKAVIRNIEEARKEIGE